MMTRRKDVEEIYHQHMMQIDAILTLMDNNYSAAARIVEWFYGGSSETWRKILAKGKKKKTIPSEVEELLAKIKGK